MTVFEIALTLHFAEARLGAALHAGLMRGTGYTVIGGWYRKDGMLVFIGTAIEVILLIWTRTEPAAILLNLECDESRNSALGYAILIAKTLDAHLTSVAFAGRALLPS